MPVEAENPAPSVGHGEPDRGRQHAKRPAKRRQRGGTTPIDDGRPAVAPDVDPAVIRARLGLTQVAFAATFGLSVGTVRDWEQGKAAPDLAARALLAVIGHRPDVVREALASYG